jgi:hypothetical protein
MQYKAGMSPAAKATTTSCLLSDCQLKPGRLKCCAPLSHQAWVQGGAGRWLALEQGIHS